jgi:hypothetical protein
MKSAVVNTPLEKKSEIDTSRDDTTTCAAAVDYQPALWKANSLHGANWKRLSLPTVVSRGEVPSTGYASRNQGPLNTGKPSLSQP